MSGHAYDKNPDISPKPNGASPLLITVSSSASLRSGQDFYSQQVKNCAVTLPFVLRPVIDSDDLWGRRQRQLSLANPLNDCVGADAHPKCNGQARSSLAANGKTDQPQRLVQAERSASVRRDEGR